MNRLLVLVTFSDCKPPWWVKWVWVLTLHAFTGPEVRFYFFFFFNFVWRAVVNTVCRPSFLWACHEKSLHWIGGTLYPEHGKGKKSETNNVCETGTELKCTVNVVREISGFRREVAENCARLRFLTLEDGTETSVRNCCYTERTAQTSAFLKCPVYSHSYPSFPPAAYTWRTVACAW